MKFSVSPKRYGFSKASIINIHIIIINPTMSLKEKYGWNGILSELDVIPNGLLDPVWCKNSKWINVIPKIIKGKTKWKVKNRVKVALSTAKPPQIHCTSIWPRYGIADRRFVITVAAQNDICPQINTYPIKAVAITKNKISTPMVQV
jgi:hypothetical protein